MSDGKRHNFKDDATAEGFGRWVIALMRGEPGWVNLKGEYEAFPPPVEPEPWTEEEVERLEAWADRHFPEVD